MEDFTKFKRQNVFRQVKLYKLELQPATHAKFWFLRYALTKIPENLLKKTKNLIKKKKYIYIFGPSVVLGYWTRNLIWTQIKH